MRLFFDIETTANPEAIALMPAPKAPGNLKDLEKIAAAIEAKKQEQVELAPLDPDYGKILSIGYANSEDGPVNTLVVGDVIYAENRKDPKTGELSWYEEKLSEATVLERFWDLLYDCGGRCVGYNIIGFDLPYLLRRSFALGVIPKYMPSLVKYHTEPTTDLMAILYNWGAMPYKGLKQVAKLYGLPVECPEVDGSMVKNMTRDQLVAYQISDVKLTITLYQRMNGIYFNH